MPKKYTLTKDQDEKFITRYNALHFHRKPFWQDYRNLHSLGADIYYVDYLRWLLEIAELLKGAYKEAIESRSKPKQKTSCHLICARLGFLLLSASYKEICDLRQEFAKRIAQQRYHFIVRLSLAS